MIYLYILNQINIYIYIYIVNTHLKYYNNKCQ